VSIFAGVRGLLDKVEVKDINRCELALLADVRARGADILDAIRKDRELKPDTQEKLKAFIESFLKSFV
jgi:F-type H+-transporting ATPase subunit alpha